MPAKFYLTVVLGSVSYCAALNPIAAEEPPRLRDAFKADFLIGAAISQEQLDGDDPRALALAAEQFSAITPENCLKWAECHPEPDRYDFERADKYVEFGEQHGMFIVGHNLVWHEQTPDWVFRGDDGKPLSRQDLLARMREHIHAVVGRYKGRINGWDVVNEAIADNGQMRPSRWRKAIGDAYLEKAFEFAHEADPDAELYYNDYNEWYPEKRKAIVRLVSKMKAKGIRIDGIGMQGHWGFDYPDLKDAESSIESYAKAAGKVMITELDLITLPDPGQKSDADITRNYELKKEFNPYSDGFPEDMQQKLAARYSELFKLFHKHRDEIARVTFWGVYDGSSWHNNWPIEGRTAYPLLFDRQYQPKPAFDAVIEVAR